MTSGLTLACASAGLITAENSRSTMSDLGLAMVEHEGDRRRIEPGVERVEHRARHRHAVVGIRASRACWRASPTTVSPRADAALGERGGEAARARVELAVGAAQRPWMIAVRSGKTAAERSRNVSGVSGWKLAGFLSRSRSYGLMRVALDGPARGVVPDDELFGLRNARNRPFGDPAGLPDAPAPTAIKRLRFLKHGRRLMSAISAPNARRCSHAPPSPHSRSRARSSSERPSPSARARPHPSSAIRPTRPRASDHPHRGERGGRRGGSGRRRRRRAAGIDAPAAGSAASDRGGARREGRGREAAFAPDRGGGGGRAPSGGRGMRDPSHQGLRPGFGRDDRSERSGAAAEAYAPLSRASASSILPQARFGLGPALALLLDDLLGRARQEIGVAELGVDLGDLGRDLLASPSSRRARSAARSTMPASGSAAISPRTTRCTDCRGAASAKRDVRQARQALRCVSRQRPSRSRTSGAGVDEDERDLRAGRHVHLRAHRADLGDQVDHPADLGLGRRRPRSPCGAGQGASASSPTRGPSSPLIAQSSSVMNGMNGCSSLRRSGRAHRRPSPASRPCAGPSRALQHRLGELEIPVAEHVPDEAVGRVGGVVEAVGLDAPPSPRRTAVALSPSIQRFSGPRAARRVEASARGRSRSSRRSARRSRAWSRSCDSPRPAGSTSLMSRPCAAIAASVKRSASAPYWSMSVERIDDVALRLRHLRALLVAHEGVDVDVAERAPRP